MGARQGGRDTGKGDGNSDFHENGDRKALNTANGKRVQGLAHVAQTPSFSFSFEKFQAN
jgi:hypothetical protein